MTDEQRIPQLAESCDPVRLDLSPTEGFLLSRIDGHTPWAVLCEIGVLAPNEVEAILEGWLSEGILVCPGFGKPADPEEKVEPDFEGELAPHLDISIDCQREILTFEAGLNRSYWELLDVPLDADPRTIKRAYFKLSRKFHPDRYYRRSIGDYAPRLDRIFKRLVEACELLSDPITRAELQQSMGHTSPADSPPVNEDVRVADEAEAETAAQVQDQLPETPNVALNVTPEETHEATPKAGESSGVPPTKRQRQRQVLDRLRRYFQIPEGVLADRRLKANQFYQCAMAALHRKNVSEAETSVRLAIAFDPWNPEYKQGFSEVLAQSHQIRAEELLERASLDGASQVEALRLYEEALHYRPCDPEINDKAARLALDLRELDKAREYAESACEVAPDEPRYRCTLGRVLRLAGLAEKAKEALKEAIRLDPQCEEAQAELKQLRRGKRRRKLGG